jgi:GlcNAc-P-P-Und epimerase
MNLLVSGAHGFLGRSLVNYFSSSGKYSIKTVGKNRDNDFAIDLSKDSFDLEEQYDVVIHAAGKAHMVPKTLAEANDFFQINHIGTTRLLEALTKNRPSTFILISTVAVYGVEQGDLISETAPLLAKDAYGKSKILAELSVIEWAEKHSVKYLILRLPLLVGKGAPGNLHDMVKGIQKGYYFNIAGGKAKRSMLLVKDVPKAIEQLIGHQGIYNLTDGYDPSYAEISKLIGKQLGKKIYSLPFFLCKILAYIGDVLPFFPLNSNKLKKLSQSLTFNSNAIRLQHGFIPSKVLNDFNL